MMRLSIKKVKAIKEATLIVSWGVGAALLYSLFADDPSNSLAFVNSFSIGLIGGIGVSCLELFVFVKKRSRHSFLGFFILKTLVYFFFFALLILLVKGFNDSVFYDMAFWDYVRDERFQRFVFKEDYVIILFYVLGVLMLIIFTRLMSRKMGGNTFWDFISGKYHHPKEVERIFMFLDLRSSTTIAEQLGAVRYHNFLKEFFSDISEGILLSKGNIYRYVADQVVVTWKFKRGLKGARCVKTFFYVKEKLEQERGKYEAKFGVAPKFSASFHCGKVVVGEIGDVKSQIVYQGEILYETFEIEKTCSRKNEELLISGELFHQLPALTGYSGRKTGELFVSENRKLELFTLVGGESSAK